ncbi:MAG: XrtA system polysaccharide deacetylase [Pseudomonadota bacterium]
MSTTQSVAHRLPGSDSAAPGSASNAPFQFVDCSAAYRGKDLPNAMSVDVEDYFQVSAFDDIISRDDWAGIEPRIADNMDRILDVFAEHEVRSTFFILGWVCRRLPQVIKKIAEAGHEVASHGDDHRRVWTKTPDEAFEDFSSTKKLLEDTSGVAVTGYRAPSFSIGARNLWAHDLLQEAGYQYSSSIFPVSHDHYGFPEAPRFPFKFRDDGLLEVPPTTVQRFGRNWPCAGGGYFRLFPYAYTAGGIRHVNQAEQMPAVFYFHPWEIDPDQPRVEGIPLKTRFRHYVNLKRFESRLTRLASEFRWSRMDEIYLRDDG